MYAKVTGDWTRAVNALARAPGYKIVGGEDDEDGALVRESVTSVRVLLSGPYGGLKLDMASYGSVLLIAGGSGVTFMLGCIEECLTRKRELRTSGRPGRGPRKVECVWVVRDMCESVWRILSNDAEPCGSDDREHGSDIGLPRRPSIDKRLPTNLPPLPDKPTAPSALGPTCIPPSDNHTRPLPPSHLATRTRGFAPAHLSRTRGRPHQDMLYPRRIGGCRVWTRGDRHGESERRRGAWRW